MIHPRSARRRSVSRGGGARCVPAVQRLQDADAALSVVRDAPTPPRAPSHNSQQRSAISYQRSAISYQRRCSRLGCVVVLRLVLEIRSRTPRAAHIFSSPRSMMKMRWYPNCVLTGRCSPRAPAPPSERASELGGREGEGGEAKQCQDPSTQPVQPSPATSPWIFAPSSL